MTSYSYTPRARLRQERVVEPGPVQSVPHRV